MNFETWNRVIAATLLATLAISVQLAAQDAAKQQHPHQYHHYQIADPGTFGGPQSFQNLGTLGAVGDLNNQGAFGGAADTLAIDPICGNHPPDCYTSHGFVFQNGAKTDLGLLPDGINSQVNWVSANGLITGLADNTHTDPVLGTPFQLRGTFWGHDRVITDIGALPGTYFAFPFAVNNRGEVIGAAMNTIPDSNSMFGIGYQTRAFYWTDGMMQDLGTLGTGTDALAGLINERGQVVGVSYTNAAPSAACAISGYPLTTGSFIWDERHGMKDLGGFGGTCTLASDLNNRGQVVGVSALPGDSIFHPFVWDAKTGITDLGTPDGGYGGAGALNENGDVAGSGVVNSSSNHALLWRKRGGQWRMTDLGTFPGGCPGPTSINASAQVVGDDSCANLPFLSEDGAAIVDLNTLAPSNSGLQLNEVGTINDRGEITINAGDANGNNHSVVLIPCDENHPDIEGCDYSMVDAATAAAQGTPAMQRPAALVPGTRMPGMLNRFRSPKGRPVPGRGIASAPASSSSFSATTDSGDLLGDHRPLPQYAAPPLYCAVSGGVLTGTCVQSTGGDNCNVTFNGCPIGLPANSGGQIVCGGGKNTFNISQTKCFSAPGFDLSASALTPTTVSAGSSATSTLTVSAYGGFGGSVTFTCVVQPTAAPAPTCSFSPSSVTSGIPATLTVSTIAPTAAFLPSTGSGLRYALWLPLFGVLATGVGSRATRKDRKAHLIAAALVCMLFVGIAVQVGCGSTSPKPGTPPGQYTVTVTGTSGSVMSSAAAMLTVQ